MLLDNMDENLKDPAYESYLEGLDDNEIAEEIVFEKAMNIKEPELTEADRRWILSDEDEDDDYADECYEGEECATECNESYEDIDTKFDMAIESILGGDSSLIDDDDIDDIEDEEDDDMVLESILDGDLLVDDDDLYEDDYDEDDYASEIFGRGTHKSRKEVKRSGITKLIRVLIATRGKDFFETDQAICKEKLKNKHGKDLSIMVVDGIPFGIITHLGKAKKVVYVPKGYGEVKEMPTERLKKLVKYAARDLDKVKRENRRNERHAKRYGRKDIRTVRKERTNHTPMFPSVLGGRSAFDERDENLDLNDANESYLYDLDEYELSMESNLIDMEMLALEAELESEDFIFDDYEDDYDDSLDSYDEDDFSTESDEYDDLDDFDYDDDLLDEDDDFF
jgi:hypothetical protein